MKADWWSSDHQRDPAPTTWKQFYSTPIQREMFLFHYIYLITLITRYYIKINNSKYDEQMNNDILL